MGCESVGGMSVAHALHQAEREAAKTNSMPNLDTALEKARTASQQPSVGEAWRSLESMVKHSDMINPSRLVASLLLADSPRPAIASPQAVGHALVMACRGGHMRCVRRLKEIQVERMGGSMMVALFSAFGLLKAAEAGHGEAVRLLLEGGTALMGYMVATRWRDREGTESYPYVQAPGNTPGREWEQKLESTKGMLPRALPNFDKSGWNLRGVDNFGANGNSEMHEFVREAYTTYLLWRVAIIAVSHCRHEILAILLKRRALENLFLRERVPGGWEQGVGGEAKRIIREWAKVDTVMFQLVEEYSTKNYHDAILYSLWTHCGSRSGRHERAMAVPLRAKGKDGIWEMQLEVPVLMMPLEFVFQEEKPVQRYKQLTELYSQCARVNIQLQVSAVAHTDFLLVTVGVKHVRFRAENSVWDETSMGHFPTLVTVSVVPQTEDVSCVTMTNSSSNAVYTVGRKEDFAVSGSGGGTQGSGGNAGIAMESTITSKPWRFEQLPLQDDNRGGSFVWTLQAMKGVPFLRSNPRRLAENASSLWKWGRRVSAHPLDELPFTSEGGVIFTGTEYADTMQWRFPESMKGKKLRWTVQGEVHSTFTTSRYFETRMATFQSDIEEELKPGCPNFETTMNNLKDELEEKLGFLGIGEEETEKGSGKADNPEENIKPMALVKFDTSVRYQFLEWLEFRKHLDLATGKIKRSKLDSPKNVQDLPQISKDSPSEAEKGSTVLPDEHGEKKAESAANVLGDESDHVWGNERPTPTLTRMRAMKGVMWFHEQQSEIFAEHLKR